MTLAHLVREIERSPGAVTIPELARRLGCGPHRVREMLVALRAAGRVGPEAGRRPGTEECAATGSCRLSCPGPTECPFIVDLGPHLGIRHD
jgi:hypothetical protein